MKSLEEELRILLTRLCIDLGFCIMLDDELERIANSKWLSADEFANAVLQADGSDAPETEVKWKRVLKSAFIEHFGTTTVGADDFRDEEL